jgi:hypothetical protein
MPELDRQYEKDRKVSGVEIESELVITERAVSFSCAKSTFDYNSSVIPEL